MRDAVNRDSQPQPWHHTISFGSTSLPHFNKNNFLSQYLHRHNSLRFRPCAHPQHMNVLKHFIYLYIGCWMQSAGLCSLKHDTTTSIGSTLPQFYKNKFPSPVLSAFVVHNSVRLDPYAHQQHNKLLKHFIYIWYGCGMHLEPQSLPYNITRPYPKFCNIHPHMHKHKHGPV